MEASSTGAWFQYQLYTAQHFTPKLPPRFNSPLVGKGHIILLLALNSGLLYGLPSQSQRDLGLRVP